MKLPNRLQVENLDPEKVQNLMVKRAITAAASFLEDNVEPLVEEAAQVESSGASFNIPLVIPEDTFSGDGRIFEKESVTTRDLPLPLMWQINTGSGHDGSVVIGRIDSIERVENGMGQARGVFDVGAYGREAERLVRNGFLRGISGDFDKFEASVDSPDKEESTFEADSEEELRNNIKDDIIRISKARLMGATLVAKPAFQECFISLDSEVLEEAPQDLPDGEYIDENELLITASADIPVVPPHEWFKDPGLNGPTSLQVQDDGRVFGHLATWNTTHIGMAGQIKPPHSSNEYSHFRSGVVRTDDGTDVTVGQLTLTHGHASTSLRALQAKSHYDDTRSAVVDVSAGEDAHGIWVAGALRPNVSPEQIRALRASGISGDWRPIDGRLELVAACCVNVAGFPTTRAMVAGGQVQALVAAGTSDLIEMKRHEMSMSDNFETRLALLEHQIFSTKAAEITASMSEDMEDYENTLSARAQKAIDTMN